jgi:hypothetical protein
MMTGWSGVPRQRGVLSFRWSEQRGGGPAPNAWRPVLVLVATSPLGDYGLVAAGASGGLQTRGVIPC